MKKIIKLDKDDRFEAYKVLKKGGTLTISGVGRVKVNTKKGVKIYNPHHDRHEVRDKTYVSFKPSVTLKNAVKK